MIAGIFSQRYREYETCANNLVQQVIDTGFRVEEMRCIIRIADSRLERIVNESTLPAQSVPLTEPERPH